MCVCMERAMERERDTYMYTVYTHIYVYIHICMYVCMYVYIYIYCETALDTIGPHIHVGATISSEAFRPPIRRLSSGGRAWQLSLDKLRHRIKALDSRAWDFASWVLPDRVRQVAWVIGAP